MLQPHDCPGKQACPGVLQSFPRASQLQLSIVPVTAEQSAAIAVIHAASWRSAYRGIFRDEFLDGDLVANRLRLWEKRLNPLRAADFGFLAVSPTKALGFVFAFGAHDSGRHAALKGGTHSDKVNMLGDQIVELLHTAGAAARSEPE